MNGMNFYRVVADPWAISRWFLGSPLDSEGNEVDPREFTYGNVLGTQPLLSLPIYQRGEKVDFNFAAFDMIVTPTTLNEEIEQLVGSGIQRFPVAIEDCSPNYFEILNVCDNVICLDEEKSYFEKWTFDSIRPDKLGQYKIIRNMHIDHNAAKGHHIFRIEGSRLELIISDLIKNIFESKKVSGVAFQLVS